MVIQRNRPVAQDEGTRSEYPYASCQHWLLTAYQNALHHSTQLFKPAHHNMRRQLNHVHLHLLTFLVIADRNPASKILFLHLSPSLTILPSFPLPWEPYKSPVQKKKTVFLARNAVTKALKDRLEQVEHKHVWKLSLKCSQFKLTWCPALLSFQGYIQHTFTLWNGKVIMLTQSLFAHLNWMTTQDSIIL